MIEAEWLTCDDPTPMLEFLRGQASDRKLRLFACGCIRLMGGLDANVVAAVEAAERFSDGLCDAAEAFRLAEVASPENAEYGIEGEDAFESLFRASISHARHLAEQTACVLAWAEVERKDRELFKTLERVQATALDDLDYSDYWTEIARAGGVPWLTLVKGQRPRVASLVRCLFGDQVRKVELGPARRSATVVSLAGTIYHDRAFERLPELADALDEAGCRDATVLAHCRRRGEHARGCWVVDLILARE